MTIVEQTAYLKGLVEGLGIEPDSRDGKLWGALTGLLSDMAHEIEDLQSDHLDLADTLDDVCEELNYMEELTLDLDRPEDFEDMDDEDDYEDEDEDLPPYKKPDFRVYDGDEDMDEEDDADLEEEPLPETDEEEPAEIEDILYDVTCPACGKEITFDEKTLDKGSITCPACGELLEFDLGDDDEE